MFKSPVLAVLSALAAASALASELPSDAPSWTGPYVGANAGYARSGSDSVRLESTPTFLVGPPLLGKSGSECDCVGGRLIAPVLRPGRQDLIVYEKSATGTRSEFVCNVLFVKLQGRYGADD